jgi:hypothetical protein
MKTTLALFLLFFAAISAPAISRAQWAVDGNPLSNAPIDQLDAAVVSDGAGGAIVAWQDNRTGGAYDIYVQRINANGATQWSANGVAVCTSPDVQDTPRIVSDGAGGAIVTWRDLRSGANYDIYAQRINAAGVAQWTANGVGLCTAALDQYATSIIPDGAGGAILTWQDLRGGANYDIYAQRINAAGAVQWTANGIAVCTANNAQASPAIVSDGSGGAIVAWQDARSNVNYDIYAQRINSAGVAQWAANGVAVCIAASVQSACAIVSDGTGGAVVSWMDGRSLANYDIYSQRLNASGSPQWMTDGVALCAAAGDQINAQMVSDGVNGAIVAWEDYRAMPPALYAQRVTSLGVAQWTPNGVDVCEGDVHDISIASDGAGGAIAAWWDGRSGTNYDIYAQRVKASGVVPWTAGGIVVSAGPTDQQFPTIAADGAGGAIVAWHDYRNGNGDIYAQRIEKHGVWGHPDPTISAVADIRADQGGRVKVNWTASDRDVYDARLITHYSIWRSTDVASALLAQSQGAIVGSPAGVKAGFKGRAVWVQHAPAADFYWEWVGNQDAHYRAAYSFSAPTRADSTSQGVAKTWFMVSAHTGDDYVFFDSNVTSGHSVDNLAPPAPLSLTAQRVGANVNLKWNRVRVADLKNYSVYRKSSSGVTAIPANFLANGTDSVLVDAAAPASALYYIVIARDVHENQSAASNEANVGTSTNVGNLPPITALTVLQNYPNPFHETTGLDVGLPAARTITISVYDVAGKRVRQFTTAGVKGWQRLALESVDENRHALASGVYFYRVNAGHETVTRKMLIMR